MSPYLNLRARLERANRNNHKVYSAWETFRKFKWFTLGMVILMPIYPSLSVLGLDYGAAPDYDESTIITAYSDDEDMPAYIAENGLIRTDFDVSTPVETQRQKGDKGSLAEAPKDPVKKSPTSTKYSVVSGDTVAKIATRYGVSTETILWANNLDASDTLSVGMSIIVPPVSGVVHTVVSGDTLSEIALHYDVDVDDIIKINNLHDAASIRKGMDLLIPGAAPKKVQAIVKRSSLPPPESSVRPQITPSSVVDTMTGLKSRYTVKYTGLSRGFVWGNCTWYVAQNKTVTWRGNAKDWMKNAKAAGVKTGYTPVPGAIIQFSGRGYNRAYGHVGIVADVTDDSIIVKDMNYRALNEVTIRKIPKDHPSIDGYIYVD